MLVPKVMVPGMPPPHGVPMMLPPPPSGPDPVAVFIQENNIDQRAAAMLRALPGELQQRIVAEGPVTGTNPSAVLTARIRKFELQDSQGKTGPTASSSSTVPGPPDSGASVGATGHPVPGPPPAGPPLPHMQIGIPGNPMATHGFGLPPGMIPQHGIMMAMSGMPGMQGAVTGAPGALPQPTEQQQQQHLQHQPDVARGTPGAKSPGTAPASAIATALSSGAQVGSATRQPVGTASSPAAMVATMPAGTMTHLGLSGIPVSPAALAAAAAATPGEGSTSGAPQIGPTMPPLLASGSESGGTKEPRVEGPEGGAAAMR